MPTTSASDDAIWRNLRPVLDEEIQRLPARYRAPFVLCHLEGKANEEAARQLGCPKGTILSRLSRARERLRARLTKRGVALSTAALAALVTEKATSATVSASLSKITLQAGLSLAATGAATGIVSTHVIALTEGVVKAMFVTKLRFAIALVLAVGVLAGAGAAGYSALTTEPAQDPKPEAEQPKNRRRGTNDFEERRAAIELQRKLQPLMEKRLDAVREQMKARAEEFLAAKISADTLFDSSANLLKAQQEMSDKPVDQLKALEMHFERMKKSQEILESRFQAGKANVADVCQAKYIRYDAEIALERYKAKLGPDGAKGEITKALFEGTEWKVIEEGLR